MIRKNVIIWEKSFLKFDLINLANIIFFLHILRRLAARLRSLPYFLREPSAFGRIPACARFLLRKTLIPLRGITVLRTVHPHYVRIPICFANVDFTIPFRLRIFLTSHGVLNLLFHTDRDGIRHKLLRP